MNPNIAEAGRATRIKKGEVRNPKGRPPSKKLSEAYAALLEAVNERGESVSDAIARAMTTSALLIGDAVSVSAAKELADRTEGKAPQSIEIKEPPRTPEQNRQRVLELAKAFVELSGK